jgi:hypothetical protein
MKFAAGAFILILLYAHGAGDWDRLLAQPLSVFRDGDEGWLGYELFGLLLLIATLYTAALTRADRQAEALVSGLASVLLLMVVLTPSLDAVHHLSSALLFLLLFGYYALLLYRVGSPWFIAHLTVPLALALATGFHSYGIWQKTFILYFVLASVVHCHVLPRGMPASAARAPRPQRGQTVRRRKVFSLEPGRSWMRRGAAANSSSAG